MVRDRVNQLLSASAGASNPGEGLRHQKAVVVCGDLNDEPEAATTQILQGPAGSEIGIEGFKWDDKGDGFRFGTSPRS
jgi:endonuclease/exonuclease/phosphatase family metal-dependent hydrolase